MRWGERGLGFNSEMFYIVALLCTHSSEYWSALVGNLQRAPLVPSRNNKYCCHIDQMTKQDCLTRQRPLETQINSQYAPYCCKSEVWILFYLCNEMSGMLWGERTAGCLAGQQVFARAFVTRILISSGCVLRQKTSSDHVVHVCVNKVFARDI